MKKKLIVSQIIICVVIFCVYSYGAKTSNEQFESIYKTAKKEIMREVTFKDVKTAGKQVISVMSEVPTKVVDVVSKANTASKYGEPIDSESSTQYKQVHAVAGGMVISSGKDNKIGLFVKIKHESATSTYGNLYDINVIENERVQRGEIIGSYDTKSSKEFYYVLEE